MEDIFQIIVVIAMFVLAIVQQTSKRGKKQTAPLPKNVPDDEMFSEVEEMDEEEPQAQPVAVPPMSRPRRHHRKPSVQAPPPATRPMAQEKKPGGSAIRLDNRQAARRAFIYSEIFRRKYE